MESNKRRVISLLVDNQSGVLARVSNLFCRRGFNIDSLTVSATNDPAVSRITVTITSDDKALKQLILQTERLEVTRQVFVLDSEKSLERELLLLKVASDVHNRSELREIASIYKAKIIDLSPDSMVFELIGKPDKIDAFLKMFTDYKFWSSAAPALPHWSAAGCISICRSLRRRCAKHSCLCRGPTARRESKNEPSPSRLRRATSPEGRGFMHHQKRRYDKSSPLGGAGIEQSEMTERVKTSLFRSTVSEK